MSQSTLFEGLRTRKPRSGRRRNQVSTKTQAATEYRSLQVDPLEDRRLLALMFDLTPLPTLGGTENVALGASTVLVGGTQQNPEFELQIVGTSQITGDTAQEAVIWSVDDQGVVTITGPDQVNGGVLAGDTNARFNDISLLGIAVGRSGNTQFGQPPATGDRATLYTPQFGQQAPALTDLGDLPGGDDFSEAVALSLTQVVGSSAAATGLRGFIWEQGVGMVDLGDLPGGGDFSFALDVNNLGQVAGGSGATGGQHAFIWDANNGIQDIGALPVTGTDDFAEASLINESGLVAGRSLVDVLDGQGQPTGLTAIVPFVYDSTDQSPVMVPLVPPTVDGSLAAVSRPFGINELGSIVGTANQLGASADTDFDAWLFSPLRGTVNLNDTLNSTGAGWHIVQARDIDDVGRIVGWGINPSGDRQAFVLTPVNDAPDLDPIANQVGQEGTLLQINLTASDTNGDELTFQIGTLDGQGEFDPDPLNLPAGMTITTIDPIAGTGRIDWTPVDDQTPVEIAVRVIDDGAGFLSDVETFMASANNVPPTADAGGPYVINETDTLNLVAIATDPGGVNDPLTYSWDVNGDSIFGDATGETPSLTWAQLNGLGIVDGTTTPINVRVRVSDGDGGITDSAPTTLTVVDLNPTADSGGPYVINEGDTLNLDGSASSTTNPLDSITNYEWDIDNDGQFDDAVGATPSVDWSTLVGLGLDDGPNNVNIRLRVTDDDGLTDESTTTLQIVNEVPVAGISGPAVAVTGQPRTYTLTGTDPSPVDQAANFTWDIDWDGDTVVDETVIGPSGTTVEHVFLATGAPTVRVTVTDKDGGTSSETTLPVDVGFIQLQDDPQSPGNNVLAFGGTAGLDAIFFLPQVGTNVLAFTVVRGNLFLNQVDFFANVDRMEAYGLGGSDIIAAEFVNQPVSAFGGVGNDVMAGGRAGDLLDGGVGNDFFLGTTATSDGNDTMIGGDGRDFFYGSLGADSIVGGAGEDLMISGSVDFGAEGGVLEGLTAIRNEWLSSRSYADRVANILGTGSGNKANGNFFLQTGVTIFDDGAIDTLVGGADMDWFIYTFLQDLATDVEPGEEETDML